MLKGKDARNKTPECQLRHGFVNSSSISPMALLNPRPSPRHDGPTVDHLGWKRLLLSALLVAIGSLAIPLSASAAEIETFVACDDSAPIPVPSHVCKIGDSPGAFFESDEETEYDVCVEFPDGEALCAEQQLAEAGVLFVNTITTTLPGDHRVLWFVEGILVGSWDFRMDRPPAPPVLAPPAPPPPVVAPAGPTPACLKARQRVRKLKSSLKKASGPKQKEKLRSKLKGARAATRRAC